MGKLLLYGTYYMGPFFQTALSSEAREEGILMPTPSVH